MFPNPERDLFGVGKKW